MKKKKSVLLLTSATTSLSQDQVHVLLFAHLCGHMVNQENYLAEKQPIFV